MPQEPSPLEEIRPLKKRELAKLREFSEVPNRLHWNDLLQRLGFLAVACVVSLMPALVNVDWSYFAMVATVAVLVAGFSLYKHTTDEQSHQELSQREKAILRDPRARVEHLEPTRGIEIELSHRQWPVYILELTGNRLVILQGPHLLDSDDDVPSTSFDLVTTVVDDVWLGIFSEGKYFKPPLEKAPESWDGDRWPDLVLIPGTLDLGLEKILDLARSEVRGKEFKPTEPS